MSWLCESDRIVAIVFDGSAQLLDVSLPAIEVVSGLLEITSCSIGDLTITDGTVRIVNSSFGDITMVADTGNVLQASRVSCDVLTLHGGAGFQRAEVDGLRCNQILADGAFTAFAITAAAIGAANTNNGTNTFTDLGNFKLDAICYRTAQEGFRFDGCVVGDVFATVLNPGAQTDNTYDGIDLIDCDRLNLYGSVRGAVNVANNPRYAIDVPAGNAAIDVWMALSGYQTGAINDPGAVVTVH